MLTRARRVCRVGFADSSQRPAACCDCSSTPRLPLLKSVGQFSLLRAQLEILSQLEQLSILSPQIFTQNDGRGSVRFTLTPPTVLPG